MEHLHDYQDPLDIDKPGYYSPRLEEIFLGCQFESFIEGSWYLDVYTSGNVAGSYSFIDLHISGLIRMKYLQAKDIQDLGFGRSATGMPMYTRGQYSILATRLFDPTYSKLRVTMNGVTVYEGICRNKSELKRILIINEINFEDN